MIYLCLVVQQKYDQIQVQTLIRGHKKMTKSIEYLDKIITQTALRKQQINTKR